MKFSQLFRLLEFVDQIGKFLFILVDDLVGSLLEPFEVLFRVVGHVRFVVIQYDLKTEIGRVFVRIALLEGIECSPQLEIRCLGRSVHHVLDQG